MHRNRFLLFHVKRDKAFPPEASGFFQPQLHRPCSRSGLSSFFAIRDVRACGGAHVPAPSV